jgi:ABC-type uncharacterized transport system substrate-binding protein
MDLLLGALRSLTLYLACVWATVAYAETAVSILLSESGNAYNEVAGALRAELERGGIAASDVKEGTDLASLTRNPAKLYIAVGAAALQTILDAEEKGPILAILLPQASYQRMIEQAKADGSRQISAVYLDQPLSRQLELIRLALPDKRRVGVVLGPQSSALSGAMSVTAEQQGLRLMTTRANTPDAIYAALQKLMSDIDVLLAAPDPTIYNSNTIQSILLTTYRAQVPMIGFSPAYVKAGALLALYSTPRQIGIQAGEIARAVLAGRPLPAAQPPRDFSIASNAHVAHSLGVHLADDAQLAERLRTMEQRP